MKRRNVLATQGLDGIKALRNGVSSTARIRDTAQANGLSDRVSVALVRRQVAMRVI